MAERAGAGKALTLEIAELSACDAATAPALCHTHVYEPDPGEDMLGHLFLVFETLNVPALVGEPRVDRGRQAPPIPRADQDSERDAEDQFAAVVTAALRDEHYRDRERSIIESFEAALGAANRALAASANRETGAWLENLHAAAAVFRGNTLHVSRVGSAELLLIRHGHLTDLGDGLSDPLVRHPQRAFNTTASGTLAEGDILVLASPGLTRIFPKERLASFLVGKHPREVVSYLRDLLTEILDAPPFAALILQATRAPITLPAPRLVPRSLGEVGSFSEVGPAPHHFGAPPPPAPPPLRPPARPLARSPLRLRQPLIPRAASVLRRGSVLLVRTAVTTLFPALRRAAARGAETTRAAAVWTKERASARLRTPTERPVPTALFSSIREAPLRVRTTVGRWPRSTRIFLVLSLVFSILFAGSLVLLSRKRAEDAAIQRMSEILHAARTKKQAAEAALIYENVGEARRLLREARAHATEVERSPYYDADATSLLAGLQEVEDKTERTVRIAEPSLAGDFGSVAPNSRLTGLASIGPSFYAVDVDTNAIVRLSSETGEASIVAQTSQGIGRISAAVALPAEQMMLFATDSPGLAMFDTARGDLVRQDVEPLPEGAQSIRALAPFGSRLYLLFPEQRQIFGYSKTLAGYQGGTPWVKETAVPVERATSMGVDGYIYLLADDGKILKLLKGAPVDFAQAELSTPLSSAARLTVNETLKHLYVLDPPNQRVVVYDTTGALSKQFVFPNTHDLRALTLGGKEETLFVLDGTAVYQVPLK